MYVYMKILLGFIVLMVALVAISGCTQSASKTATPATTVATPIQTTVATTMPPTTEITTAPITVATTAPVSANITTPTPTITGGVPIPVATTPWTAPKVAKIYFNSTGFNPASDIVLPGMGVTWINDDTVPHVIIATGNNTGMFNSGTILPGGNFVYTFCLGSTCQGEGTITYGLQDVPSAQGTIIVQAQQQHLMYTSSS
jgi:plastocyanin